MTTHTVSKHDELTTPIERERDELRRVLVSIAEGAIQNEGVRMASSSYSDDDCVDVTLTIGDLRAAVRLTNHDCQNADRIKYAGPSAPSVGTTVHKIQVDKNKKQIEALIGARGDGVKIYNNANQMIAALNKIAGHGDELMGIEGLSVALAGEHLKYPVGKELARIADALEDIASKMP